MNSYINWISLDLHIYVAHWAHGVTLHQRDNKAIDVKPLFVHCFLLSFTAICIQLRFISHYLSVSCTYFVETLCIGVSPLITMTSQNTKQLVTDHLPSAYCYNNNNISIHEKIKILIICLMSLRKQKTDESKQKYTMCFQLFSLSNCLYGLCPLT